MRTANTYANGMHTSVVSRKLVTGSKFDVQFANMAARYGFGFAAFDNAQVRHATSDEPMHGRAMRRTEIPHHHPDANRLDHTLTEK